MANKGIYGIGHRPVVLMPDIWGGDALSDPPRIAVLVMRDGTPEGTRKKRHLCRQAGRRCINDLVIHEPFLVKLS